MDDEDSGNQPADVEAGDAHVSVDDDSGSTGDSEDSLGDAENRRGSDISSEHSTPASTTNERPNASIELPPACDGRKGDSQALLGRGQASLGDAEEQSSGSRVSSTDDRAALGTKLSDGSPGDAQAAERNDQALIGHPQASTGGGGTSSGDSGNSESASHDRLARTPQVLSEEVARVRRASLDVPRNSDLTPLVTEDDQLNSFVEMPPKCEEFVKCKYGDINKCVAAIQNDARYSKSSQYRELLRQVEALLEPSRNGKDTRLKDSLRDEKLLDRERTSLEDLEKRVHQELGFRKRDKAQQCINFVEKMAGRSIWEDASELAGDNQREKTSIDREALQDQENRLREDYAMFRDAILVEHDWASGRISAFATFQGFLWAAISVSLTGTVKDDRDIAASFVIGASLLSLLVTLCSLYLLYLAKLTISRHVLKWERILYVHEKTNGVVFWGPGIIDRRQGACDPALLLLIVFLVGSGLTLALGGWLLARSQR